MVSQDWFDKDFYKIFGVFKDVSDVDLKKMYCKFVWKYYLDFNQGDVKVEVKFKEISEVYLVFFDVEQCKEYDEICVMGLGVCFMVSGQGVGGFEDVFSCFGQQG